GPERKRLGLADRLRIAKFASETLALQWHCLMNYLLTILILLPVIGAATTLAYGFTPGARASHHRWIALGFTTLSFVASLLLIQGAGSSAGFRFEENYSWIALVGARYHLGVDGISLWLVLLTTLLMPI